MEEYSVKNNKNEIESNIENKLIESTLDCLMKIKSTFLVMHNSFFTIANKDLIVLKCFISKNSNSDITKFLPLIGSNLKEEPNGKTSIFQASIENTTVQIKNNLNKKKEIMEIQSIATPVKYQNKVIGYISLTTLNNDIINILNIFIESFVLNIERSLEKSLVKEELIKFMKLAEIKTSRTIMDFLSVKERIILQYMLMAYSNIEIANEMCISESTVKTYFKRIYEKCGTNNRVDTSIAIICSNILEKLN